MSRKARDSVVRKAICTRFSEIVEGLYGNMVEGADVLGYSTSSTLYSIRKGKVLPDLERLAKLSKLRFKDGARPNIDWIITGIGEKKVRDDVLPKTHSGTKRELEKALKMQSDEKLEAILELLR